MRVQAVGDSEGTAGGGPSKKAMRYSETVDVVSLRAARWDDAILRSGRPDAVDGIGPNGEPMRAPPRYEPPCPSSWERVERPRGTGPSPTSSCAAPLAGEGGTASASDVAAAAGGR